MKPKILLLSNSMLFHFSFCSLYKNEFEIKPYLLRYLNKNLSSQAEHFYIQIQEQKRRKLYKNGVLSDPNRVILTSKSIQTIVEECENNSYHKIILEINNGNKEELTLLKKLNKTNLPISIFINTAEDCFLNEIKNLNINSLYQLTDLFSLRTRF
ncbi:hypothetical protein [Priestia aryabhattai]